MKILLIEDDEQTAGFIQKGFVQQGHVIDHAKDGHDGLLYASENTYDVMIIDRMIPKIEGLILLKTLREMGIKTPALFLTALGSIEDRVKGLTTGGDDYLVKPFAFSELYARIISLSRRPPLSAVETKLSAGTLIMNLIDRTVMRDNHFIELQPTEFRLLEYFLKHQGEVITKTMLLEGVWGFNFDPKTNIVETYISRLRSKIDKGFDKELLKTIRGIGYRLDA